MRRNDIEEWSFMGQNLQVPSSHSHSPLNHLNHLHPDVAFLPENRIHPMSQYLLSQNPQARFHQNPTSQNNLYQNHGNHLSFDDDLAYDMIEDYLEFGFHQNPTFVEPFENQSLETAFSRLNLSTPSYQFAGNNSHQPHLFNKMRSVPVPTFNHSFSNISNNNGNNLQRPSPSYDGISYGYSARPNTNHNGMRFDGLSYGYSATPNANHNGMRLDSGSHSSRARSITALESTNSNIVMISDLYNHKLLQLRRQANYPALEQLKGRVALMAKDQVGYNFLRKMLDERKPEQTGMIFLEVKDHLQELMKDQFGNYVIQKLFEVCNEEQMTQLILFLISEEQGVLQGLCVHSHGTRAIQKMIEHIKTPQQKSLLISGLKHITVILSMDQNGHHVIQQCLKHFSVDDTEDILYEIAKNCLEVAMDKSGCCVLQRSLSLAEGTLKDRLVAEIIANTIILSEHSYGNYVVQYVLGMHLPDAQAKILEQLRGYHATLSLSKYGSNVVEKCLKECGEDNAKRIIQELVHSPIFLDILKNNYGNYVAQSALLVSKGGVRHALETRINSYYQDLHSHPFGKRVLARIRGNRYYV